MAALAVLPSASADRSIRLAVSWTPASSASSPAALANGTAAAARAAIARSPGDKEAPVTASSPSLGTTPCPQFLQWYQARRSVTGPSTVSMVLAR
jgi:hypothetical protein